MYSVFLEFKREVPNITGSSKHEACLNALHKATCLSKVQSELLFQEMIQAGMNKSYIREE